MQSVSFLDSLAMSLYAVAWLCACGAFFDLVVIGFFRRVYLAGVKQAEQQYRLHVAAQFTTMLVLLERIERLVSFLSCWNVLKGSAQLLRQRLSTR